MKTTTVRFRKGEIETYKEAKKMARKEFTSYEMFVKRAIRFYIHYLKKFGYES